MNAGMKRKWKNGRKRTRTTTTMNGPTTKISSSPFARYRKWRYPKQPAHNEEAVLILFALRVCRSPFGDNVRGGRTTRRRNPHITGDCFAHRPPFGAGKTARSDMAIPLEFA